MSTFIWSYDFTKQAQECLERNKNVMPPEFACFICRKEVPKHCSAVMTCTLNEVQPALITVKPFTPSEGLEISLGGRVVLVHFELLSTREGGRLAV